MKFDSISAMISGIVNPQENEMHEVLGYASPGDGGGGSFYWDANATETEDKGIIFLSPTISTGRWKRLYDGAVNLKWFGASTTSTDNYLFLKRALGYKSVYIPEGTYQINTAPGTIPFLSDTMLTCDENACLKLTGSTALFLTNGKAHITIQNLSVEGSGAAGAGSVIRFDACKNVKVIDACITKVHGTAIKFFKSEHCTVTGASFIKNYLYGIEDELGAYNNYLNCYFLQNGTTDTATSTTGRGLVLWKTKGCQVEQCKFIGNNEYGLRLYSEAGDTDKMQGCQFNNNFFKDNGNLDIYVYNASNSINNCSGDNNIIERTTNASTGFSLISVQGDYVTLTNTKVINNMPEGRLASIVNLNAANYCVIDGISVTGISNFITYSGTAKPSYCTLKNVIVNDCITVCPGIQGKGHRFEYCHFYHGGSGTMDTAIVADSNAEGKLYFDHVLLDGFYRGLVVSITEVSVKNCTTTNSLNFGIYKIGDNLAGFDVYNNNFDKAFPAELTGLISIYKPSFSRRICFRNIPPFNLGWDTGDIVLNTVSTNGAAVGWRCQQAGAPGTWVPFGLLNMDHYGSNSPEGVITAPIGAIFRRSNGGINTAVYIKETGFGNTGWVPINTTGTNPVPVRTVTAGTTILSTDYTLLVNNTAAINISLPDATLYAGRIFIMKKVSNNTNPITVITTSAQTIDGNVNAVIPLYNEVLHIQSDGTNWQIIN